MWVRMIRLRDPWFGAEAALASGASNVEAAELACLAASVTVKKLGVTGTASPQELIEKLGGGQQVQYPIANTE